MTARIPFNPRKALADAGGRFVAAKLREMCWLHGIACDRRALYHMLRARGARAVDAWRWAGAA